MVHFYARKCVKTCPAGGMLWPWQSPRERRRAQESGAAERQRCEAMAKGKPARRGGGGNAAAAAAAAGSGARAGAGALKGSQRSLARTVGDIFVHLRQDYEARTSLRMKMIDCYLAFALLTAAVQFTYCALVGTFPFNSFLSGFICTVGVFVFGVALRKQISGHDKDYQDVTPERAFLDFVLCNVILFFAVVNFLG